ncbi:MAG: gamma carbonic anhydrase family protein [Pseudomonadota bacterium]
MRLYTLDGVTPEVPDDGDYWIAPGAYVIGNVRLGPGVGIWFGAALRGDNELIDVGAGTNIQENTVCHTDPGFPLTIGENCTIGHKAMLHGCTIGDGALIGMGATVLNGAVIGEGALIGAGALVTEGKVIAPRTLVVGAPAKPVRELDDAAVAGLLASAAHYRANMRRFRAGLAPVPQ